MRPGLVIKSLREAEGLTQEALAREIGFARTYLAQVESGRREPGLPMLRMTAKHFRLPVALFLIDEHGEGLEVLRDLKEVLENVLDARAKQQPKS